VAKGQIKQAQIKIDKHQFEQLCKMQCTKTEIASWFEVNDRTLLRWCEETYGTDFVTIYEQKKEGGKIALRRYQLQQAEKNPTMAIWLGKQYLNQRDNVEVEHDVKNGILGDLIGALNKAKENK
jgi:hypothetical protein